jgi:hypothetical protein
MVKTYDVRKIIPACSVRFDAEEVVASECGIPQSAFGSFRQHSFALKLLPPYKNMHYGSLQDA